MKIIFVVVLIQFSQYTMGRQKDSPTKPEVKNTGQFQFYFPMRSDQSSQAQNAKALDSFQNRWYSRMLAVMNEPILTTTDEDIQVYRFTWLRTFQEPVMVKIQYVNSRSNTVTATILDGKGGYKPGNIETRKTFKVRAKHWKAVERKIRQCSFWEQPSSMKADGFDGEEWVLEGRIKRQYHFMTRWSPDEKSEFGKCCLYILSLAGIKPETMSDELKWKLEDIEDRAEDHYYDSSFNRAISLYKKIVDKSAANPDMRWNAMMHIADIYAEKLDYTSAYQYYARLMPLCNSGWKKRQICRKSARMEINRKNYSNALQLLKSHDQYTVDETYCGNALAAEKQELAEMYFQLYLGLKDSASAIRAILPHIFYNGLVENKELVDRVIPVFIKRFGKDLLKTELDKSAENIVKTTIAKDAAAYQTTLFGVVIPVPEFHQSIRMTTQIPATSSQLEKRKFTITKSYFYWKACLSDQPF